MKKLFVSVGILAAGTAGLQAAYAPDANTMTASKVWSVSGTLRGFYDDNYLTSPTAKGSLGFEVSPQVGLNLALQQTELGMSYTYGMYYYFDQSRQSHPIDQTHQFDLWLDHSFTERWQTRVSDSFVVGQEPELIGGGQVTRVEGNNIRNTANLSLNTLWTRLFSTKLDYQNTFYDYQNANGTAADPSLAGLLNRVEQSVSLDLQWAVAPETTFFIGGMVSFVDYTANEPIGQYLATTYHSDARNNRSYFGYVGLERSMLANLSFSGRAGVQYTDNFNDPGKTTSLNPYADLSLIYTYVPGSYVQVGFTETQEATDQIGLDSNGHITVSMESSTLYAALNHKLTPKLMSSTIARWQHSIFDGGAYNNKTEDYFSLGLNLSYTFNPHLSAEVGYNFDDLQSQIAGNKYTRNRVYLGASLAY